MNEDSVGAGGAHTCVLACTSLLPFVEQAQMTQGTALPVFTVDRAMHNEPETMKAAVQRTLSELPPEYATVLVAMGFCGGVWDHVRAERRLVIPRTDDCVSLLLHTDDAFCPNRKEPGHLYLYENDPADFSALTLARGRELLDADLRGLDRDFLFHMMFDNYRHMDIIDTGLNDCYSEDYVLAAQQCADEIGADLDYVPGSIRLLEKLLSGHWDEQFLVAEPGRLLLHGDFFG